MSWILVALSGYLFNALAALFDKFLLSEERIGSPALYAFYTSLVSLFAVVLIPFGFVFAIPKAMFLGFFSGFLFLLGLVAFYESVKRSEVSRAAPLVGVSVVGFLFLVSLLLGISSGQLFHVTDVMVLGLLVAGSFALSKHTGSKRDPLFARYVLVAGALMAASLIVLKETYVLSNFSSGFVWSRLGMFLTGMSFLLFPLFREQIFSGGERHAKPTKRNFGTATYFFLNKAFGGAGAFLIAYAVSLGPVTFIQGLNGTQFAFLFLLVIPLSFRYPHIFGERLDRIGLVEKVFGIMLLSLGVFLAASSGNLKGFL